MLDCMLDHVSENSNINHKCPYDGLVLARNLRINQVMFKDLIPQGEYIVRMRIYNANTNQTIIEPILHFVAPSTSLQSYSIGK